MPTDKGYIVGCNGTILKTTNGGVGINDQHQTMSLLCIYPNPAIAKITIITPTKGSIFILNLNGKQLIQERITELKTTMDINALPIRVYVIKLMDEDWVHIGKIVKN
jgi:hypothetical protein